MLHEYGHFEGYTDSGAAPGTIEYERPDLARVPLCERFRLVYGHRVFSGHAARAGASRAPGRPARGPGPSGAA
jgi:hypothetical protein